MSLQNDFPTVEELSNGFSEFKLEQTEEFLGKMLRLFDEKNNEVSYTFVASDMLEVYSIGAEQSKIEISEYSIVSPRPGIFMLDYIESHEEAKSVTIVIDMNRSIATIMNAQLPSKEEADVSQLIRAEKNMPMTSVTVKYVHASVNVPFGKETEKHEFTEELIGKHVRFKYTDYKLAVFTTFCHVLNGIPLRTDTYESFWFSSDNPPQNTIRFVRFKKHRWVSTLEKNMAECNIVLLYSNNPNNHAADNGIIFSIDSKKNKQLFRWESSNLAAKLLTNIVKYLLVTFISPDAVLKHEMDEKNSALCIGPECADGDAAVDSDDESSEDSDADEAVDSDDDPE